MGSLLDELKSRENDYILVTDALELIAKLTESSLDEVKTYLLAHKIDEFIYVYYKDEFYNFEVSTNDTINSSYETFNAINGKDGNIAYFKKKDLAEFEPLRKLNLFGFKTDLPKNKIVYLGEYQQLLITFDLFTPEQITCLLANYNPAYNHNDDKFNAYAEMVSNAIDAGLLEPINDKGQIPANQVKKWLFHKNYVYDGFNDNIDDPIKADCNENYLTIIREQKKRISELEQQLELSNTHSDVGSTDYLSIILDDSLKYHAPDLKHAINLWIDLYINGNIKQDSHSNKANQWIFKNTGYTENDKTSTERIKEISSPLRYWSPHRKKEI